MTVNGAMDPATVGIGIWAGIEGGVPTDLQRGQAAPSPGRRESVDEPVALKLSPEAQELLERNRGGEPLPTAPAAPAEGGPEERPLQRDLEQDPDRDPKQPADEDAADSSPQELPREQEAEVAAMEKRDQEVRTHEQQHLAAAGGHARGGAHYSFETGPDGKRYVVEGHVNIDTSAVPDDPEATIQKAQTIRRAALAPAQPSGADRAVAAKAGRMETQARQELASENGDAPKADNAADGGNAAATGSESAAADGARGIAKAAAAYRRNGAGEPAAATLRVWA